MAVKNKDVREHVGAGRAFLFVTICDSRGILKNVCIWFTY